MKKAREQRTQSLWMANARGRGEERARLPFGAVLVRVRTTRASGQMERIWHFHVNMNCQLGEKCSCQPHRGNG